MSAKTNERSSRRHAERYATLAAGWTLLAVGAVLLVLPGPGFPLVLGGLALLGRELSWARRLRRRIEAKVRRQPPPAATPPPVSTPSTSGT
jgi:Putative transmembrane protein (PGPGW)